MNPLKNLFATRKTNSTGTPLDRSVRLGSKQQYRGIECLESRIAPAIVAGGINRLSAVFLDADGDQVVVKILGGGPARFDITLDGGVFDGADIDAITIKNGLARNTISIDVIPKKQFGSAAGIGGTLFSSGWTEINEINQVGTSVIKGIASRGAALDFVNLPTTDITSLSLGIGRAAQIDKINAAAISITGVGGYEAQAGYIDMGRVDAKSIGTLSIIGLRSEGTNGNPNGPNGFFDVNGNDFIGPINVSGAVKSIVGSNATFTDTAQLNVAGGNVDRLNVYAVHAPLTAMNFGQIEVQHLGGAEFTTTNAASNLVFNNQTNDTFQINAAGTVDFGSTNTFNGVIVAGGHISGLLAGSADAIVIKAGSYFGTLHSLAGNVTGITVTNTTSTFSGTVLADAGSVGALAAGQFGTSNIVAGTTVGSIASLGSISDMSVVAGTGIGAIAAGHGLSSSVFHAIAGNIGNVTSHAATSDGTAIIDSAFNAAQGSIGNIFARSLNNFTGTAAIESSTFASLTGIGTINAQQLSATGGEAIANSTFDVNGAGSIVSVFAEARNDSAIDGSFFQVATGNIGAVTGTSGNGTGIENTVIIAHGSNIGLVTGISTRNGHGLDNVQIEAGDGLVGTGVLTGVLGTSLTGTGITNSLITAGSGGIGSITGTSSTSGQIGFGDGIANSRFFTTGSVTAITGTSASGHGITISTFSADGNLALGGGITAKTTSTFSDSSGIIYSTFRSGASIGAVTASTAISSAVAIRGDAFTSTTNITLGACSVDVPIVFSGSTVFSALGNVGAFNVAKGDIRGVVAMAGYDIGSDVSFDGFASGHDFIPLTTAATTLGPITVSNGDIHDSAFTSGVVTTDTILGNADDVLNGAGSSIGAVTTANNGLIENVVLESGTIGALSTGKILGLNLVGFTPGGSLGNIKVGVGANGVADTGALNVDDQAFPGSATLANAAFRVGGNIGTIDVANASAGGGSAILNSLFQAGFNNPAGNNTIGNITVVTRGGDASGGSDFSSDKSANAIDDSCFNATGSIGNVDARVIHPNGVFAGTAILGSEFIADTNNDDNGAIGTINAATDGAAGDADGIRGSTFQAGNGIGAITVTVGAPGSGAGDDGIEFSTFTANFGATLATGSIGNIKVTSTAINGDGITFSNFTGASMGSITIDPPGDDGIENSTFTAQAGSIGNINVSVGAAATASTPATGDDAIADSTFTATTTIGTITALTFGGRTDDGAGFAENADGHDAIVGSLFFANSDGIAAGVEGIGAITATAQGTFGDSDGIDDSTFSGTDIASVTALTSVDDGIEGSTFTATTGAIGPVSGTSTGTGAFSSGILQSSFTAGTSIGTVSGITAGDDGIDVVTLIAGTSIGNILGTSSNSANASAAANGIGFLSATAGTTIGTITGTSTSTTGASDGITQTTVLAGGGIGNIQGTTTSTAGGADGIDTSTFRSGGTIGTVTGTTASTAGGLGIKASGFNAQQNIGNIASTGNILGSAFIAGVNLGTNFLNNATKTGGNINVDATVAPGLGYGGAADTAGAAPATIGTVTLTAVAGGTPGKLDNTSIIAGVVSYGTDNLVGGAGAAADTVLAGSTIGAITAPGGIDPVFVMSGAIGNTLVTAGTVDATHYVAFNAAGTGIGSVTVTAPNDGAGTAVDAISNSTFTSANGIGAISATTNDVTAGSNAIFNTKFRTTGGSITSIAAVTADVAAAAAGVGAIVDSGFNARQNIGAITSTGHITRGVFVAGVSLGNDFLNNLAIVGGNINTTNTVAPGLGYGGAGEAADVAGAAPATIGTITLTTVAAGAAAKINDASIIAGVVSFGADNLVGGTVLNADTTLAGSTVGAIVAPGGIDPVFVMGDSIGTTNVGSGVIDATHYVAFNAAGTGIGAITVTNPDDANAGTSPDAISNSSFRSAAGIGNINAANADVVAGSDGISTSQFLAGTGIGTITATAAGAGAGSEGIDTSVFRASNGNIGAITATAGATGADAIFASVFSAGRTAGAVGNIGAIVANGGGAAGANITNTRFVAGYDIGADLAVGGADDLVSAAASSIASITVNGRFIESDAITSAGQGATAGWGNDAEASVAGSSIGAVTIGQPVDPAANYIADGVEDHAIQSLAIGTVTIGGGAASVPPGQYDPNADGENGNEIRIRVI